MNNKIRTKIVLTITTDFDNSKDAYPDMARYCFEEDLQEDFNELYQRYNIEDVMLLEDVLSPIEKAIKQVEIQHIINVFRTEKEIHDCPFCGTEPYVSSHQFNAGHVFIIIS